MIINHNMNAMNAHRMMTGNTATAGKSMEKLSSGLRINRAGDDAAGLAISEKMRGQIRGLDQASRNAQDGISMIQTAEGALSETHSILQRMKELATQAANGTNTPVETEAIQKEINQLTSEINRIGNTTEFNQQKVLNGGGAAPTTTSSSNGLTVPANLVGGVGDSETLASAAITFVTANAATDYDGKSFTLNIGGKSFTVNTTMTDASTGAGTDESTDPTATLSGNTITLAVNYDSDGDANNAAVFTNATGTKIATALDTVIDSIISNDADLKGKYTSGTVGAALTVTAVTQDIDAQGKLTGAGGVAGNVTITNSTGATALDADEQSAITNTEGAGQYASGTIDFTGKSVTDLVGSGIVIGDKKVDFYDSSKGAYSGDADFSIDLRGAGNAEAIVDKIVDALHNGTATRITDSTGAESVYVTKSTTDVNKLQLTAVTIGGAGNNIAVENNASVTVSNVDLPDQITGANVTAGKGLEDGDHTISVSNVAAKITENTGSQSGNGDLTDFAATIDSDSKLATGTYRLTNQGTANHAQLQKLGSDGTTWSTVEGYEDITITGAQQTVGDLTFTYGTAADFTAAAAGTDSIAFSISANHYEASLTETGGTAGTAVVVSENEKGVTLKSQDGVGEVTLDMGTISGLAIGSSATIRFSSEAAGTTATTVGGTFSTKFQIGANNGQSFDMSIHDMRSQALNISGTTASANQGAVANAKFTSTKGVTDGTNNVGTEFALDISSHDSASAAIEVIGNAINQVSAQRSELGAMQNRLEHTINNLNTSSENLTSAESRIRDVDMAKEMMTFSKNNILSQAAQAMLAQANQQPQGVLQLLR